MADNDLIRADGTRLKIGDQIVSDRNYAVIKFIGEVPPTTGIWLGVEWHDPHRGKHDGTHNGKRYFQTTHPSSGSFVRPTKVNGGITIVKAIHDRYGLKQEGDAGVKTEDLFVLDKSLNQTIVEMVGAKKINLQQSEFQRLKKISVYEMLVYGAGPSKELQSLCPSVVELDVAKSLLPSWESVAEIASQLPYLKELNTSENILQIPKDVSLLSASFAKVKNLVVNKMRLTWKDILKICSMFPALEGLHACFNNLQEISESRSVLKGLKTLDIQTNDISDWEHVLKLGDLPNLENLVISENKLKSIYFPCDCSEQTEMFSKLKTLIIKDNLISEWSSIDEINKLHVLEELQVANNPIVGTYKHDTVRQMLIAKIATLKLTSRTPITYEERKGAEIDYLKRFGKEWKKAGGHIDSTKNKISQEFTIEHPRFLNIIEKWGAPEDEELTVKSTALKDNLLAIKIVSKQHEPKSLFNKKLPGSMSVQKLKTLIQRLFKMSSEPTLCYTSHKVDTGQEIELDNDMRHLSFYSLESEDTIIVRW